LGSIGGNRILVTEKSISNFSLPVARLGLILSKKASLRGERPGTCQRLNVAAQLQIGQKIGIGKREKEEKTIGELGKNRRPTWQAQFYPLQWE